MRAIFRVFFVMFFIGLNELSAIEIDSSYIYEDSYFIQVGAYKRASNIEKVKERLLNYDIYLEPYKDLHRVHVVNISKDQLKETLRRIRLLYPGAFISKRAGESIPKKSESLKESDDFYKLSEPLSDKIKIIDTTEPTLDSNTILKTRKSFL